MSVRTKILIIISLTFLVLVGMLFAASRWLIYQNVTIAEGKGMARDLARLAAALDHQVEVLDATAGDWAPWDETYEFILSGDSSYILSNLGNETLANLGVELIVFVNNAGQIVYGKRVELESQEELPIPESLYQELQPGGRLLDHPTPEDSQAGLLSLPEGTLLLASRPILTSQHEGPIRGTLIMGRWLNETAVEQLAQRTQLTVDAFPYQDAGLPDDVARARQALTESEPVWVVPQGETVVSGYTFVNDIYGAPALLLQIEVPREIYAQAKASVRFLGLAWLAIGIVLGLVMVRLLDRLVLARLSDLTTNVREIGNQGISSRLTARGNDEIFALATDVNSMLDSLEAAQAREYESGERFRQVYEHMQVGVARVSLDFLIQAANQAYCNILGYSEAELTGKHLRDLTHPETIEEYLRRQAGLAAGEIENYRMEGRFIHKSGRLVHGILDATLVRNAQGTPLYFLDSVLDVTEQKAVEEALHASEVWYRAIYDSSPLAMVVWDRERRVVDWNRQAEQVFGWAREEILGKDFFKFLLPESALPAVAGVVDALLRGNLPSRSVNENLTKRGKTILCEWNNSIQRDSRGQVTGVISLALDITARKQAEEALRASESRFREIIEGSQDIIYRQNFSDGILDYMSPSVTQVLGYTPDEMRSMSMSTTEQFRLFHPADLPFLQTFRDDLEKADASGVKFIEREFRMLTSSGDHRWIHGVYRLTRNSAGLPEFILGTLKDITERKRAEDALRRLAERWAILYRMGKEIGASLDIEEAYAAIHQAVQQLMPCEDFIVSLYDESRNEMSGSYIVENGNRIAPSPYMADRGLGGWIVHGGKSVLLNSPEEIASSGIQFEPYGSGPATSSVIGVPMYIKGKIVGILSAQSYHANAYTRDDLEAIEMLASHTATAIDNARLFEEARREIAERKRAEQQLAQYTERLEEMVDERTRELRAAQERLVRQERLATLGQLAGSISHELRNPLGIISNAVFLLKMKFQENDPHREYLDMIENEARTADKIISDLLDFTRIKSLDRRAASVSELVQQVLERYPAPPAVEVRLAIPANLPPVFVDPRHIIQILGNLIVNACQAIPETGKLTLSARVQDDMIAVAVQDTGIGIPPDHMSRLFEPLFTTKVKGIGLGLPVSQKLAEANGGRIEVESEAGQGSTFTLFLPIYKELA